MKIGRLATTICHLGNIASRLGRDIVFDPKNARPEFDSKVARPRAEMLMGIEPARQKHFGATSDFVQNHLPGALVQYPSSRSNRLILGLETRA